MDGVESGNGRCSSRLNLDFGMCLLRGYTKSARMGRLVSETLCFTETSGQGRLSWHAILHVSFLSKLIPGLASLDLDANKSVSRKALSCCAH